MREQKLITKQEFDEEIEWTWFYLWHHEGRRARHGASMMAPDYAHWHGMYEVAERFYQELIPQAREIAHQAEEAGQTVEAEAVRKVIEDLLNRPEHTWYEEMKTTLKKGAADHAAVTLPGETVAGDTAADTGPADATPAITADGAPPSDSATEAGATGDVKD